MEKASVQAWMVGQPWLPEQVGHQRRADVACPSGSGDFEQLTYVLGGRAGGGRMINGV